MNYRTHLLAALSYIMVIKLYASSAQNNDVSFRHRCLDIDYTLLGLPAFFREMLPKSIHLSLFP
jgi:hypothetical protein